MSRSRDTLTEAMARAMCEKSLGPKQCPCFGKEFKCADAHPAFQATAALAAIEAAGFVCVPREPTRIMLNRGMEAYINWREAIESQCLDEKEVTGIYRDMIAASPLAQEARDAE